MPHPIRIINGTRMIPVCTLTTVGDRVVVTTPDPKPPKWSDLVKSMVFATGRAPAAPGSVLGPLAISFYYFYQLWNVVGPLRTSERPDPSQNPIWGTRSGQWRQYMDFVILAGWDRWWAMVNRCCILEVFGEVLSIRTLEKHHLSMFLASEWPAGTSEAPEDRTQPGDVANSRYLPT